MKVQIFNEKSTNRPKHVAKKNYETHRVLATLWNTEGPKHCILQGIRDKKFYQFAKYDKFPTLKNVDSKNHVFSPEGYSGSSGAQHTSTPNRELPTNRFRLWKAPDEHI